MVAVGYCCFLVPSEQVKQPKSSWEDCVRSTGIQIHRGMGTTGRTHDTGSEDIRGTTWKTPASNFHTHPHSWGKEREKGKGKKYPFQSKDVVRPKQPPMTHEPGCRDAVFSRRKGRILLSPLLNKEFTSVQARVAQDCQHHSSTLSLCPVPLFPHQ